MGTELEMPWESCTIQFRHEAEGYEVWTASMKSRLFPKGWKLVDYDADYVPVRYDFTVEGAPTKKDGEAVKKILDSFVKE